MLRLWCGEFVVGLRPDLSYIVKKTTDQSSSIPAYTLNMNGLYVLKVKEKVANHKQG